MQLGLGCWAARGGARAHPGSPPLQPVASCSAGERSASPGGRLLLPVGSGHGTSASAVSSEKQYRLSPVCKPLTLNYLHACGCTDRMHTRGVSLVELDFDGLLFVKKIVFVLSSTSAQATLSAMMDVRFLVHAWVFNSSQLYRPTFEKQAGRNLTSIPSNHGRTYLYAT